MTCTRCGQTITIGDWPFCPHGRGTYAAIADDIPGGLVLHNLGPTPVRVYSHTERRRIMRAQGLRECVRDGWNAVCETTLANARDLVGGDRRGARDARGESLSAGAAVVAPRGSADPAAVSSTVSDAEVETLVMTVRERPGFRVRPDGEPYVP
jgi:hypothetical protein